MGTARSILSAKQEYLVTPYRAIDVVSAMKRAALLAIAAV
jgi:hypothetical protein